MANSEIEMSTNNTPGGEYQVFLSFRGLDTRRGFTNTLYHGLVDAGIRVFIDDEELRLGERISDNLLRAIDNSELYIPIFSKNYASSHWCLRELAKMVENTSKSKEDGKKVILPIFYDVKPDDVKLKTGLYRKAISNLKQKKENQKKKFSCEDVEMWQRALKEVDGTKGLELKKYPGYGDLIKLVVNEVVVRLKTRQRQVSKYLTGMEYQIAAIKNLLEINSGGVRLIGIYGMSGIGKTTLAKLIFNQLCPCFGTNCSFLDDVRETAKTKGLVELQKQLLSDISHSIGAQNIGNIDHGINMIGQTICNRKMLIVLDDVDEGSQIQRLFRENSLHPGTRILVTTRDKSILNIRGFKFEDYEMKRLSNKDALQLFSRHAFDDDSPPSKYRALSEGIASTTDGLPLALEAIGLSLFGQENEKIWVEMLEKLRKSPHRDVFGKLRISYDALESDQQQIFLDVACFIIGKKKTNPMYMWEASKFGPEIAIDVLTKRCMIKVFDNDRFGMHDQFRDLGRVIAKEEQTRLQDRDDIICQLRSIKIKESVQALHLPSSDLFQPLTITSEEIKRFPNLRILWLYDVIFQGDFTGCLSQLKWISLQNPPHPDASHHWFGATNLLHLENVVVVNLFYLDFPEDVFENLIKVGKKLKVLTLEHNRSICGIPSFPEYSVLEKLTISECPFLMEIDCSIGKLRCLTDLIIESCLALKKLPIQIGELQRLQQLSIWNCPSLSELPNLVSKLVHIYQVFLSFKGLDTHRTFTNSLYHALVDAGIRVFINEEELQPSERISGHLLQAIDDSELYIPIFCKNYASTHQCLRELAKMVENTSKSKEDGKKKVILPIFYDVKPSDVKLKTALYSEAISNLEQKMEDRKKKFSSKDVETWRQALGEVGGIKGWELEKYSGYGDLIESVVEEVLVKLKTRQEQVPEHLVGMEDTIEMINQLLDIDSGHVKLIGICGIGGIGKTTLAKIIFNQLCPQFGRNCSFLNDVRKRAKTEDLVKLQNELLSDMSHSSGVRYVGTIDHGMKLIEKTICNKKMLVVLDDVDEAYQINYLIGMKYLYPGTIILVTTRNKSALRVRKFRYNVMHYEMEGLSNKDILELFSRCAFSDNSPPANYYTLSKSIVSTAHGLPLALKATDSSLFGPKKRQIWEEMPKKLKKGPHKDVLAKLRISYDALELDQQQIFLDVACFFVGENYSDPMYLWKDCGFYPVFSIGILINNSMIKVLDDDRFWMHDHFRDLGRDIAKQEHTRLWDKDDIICQLRSTKIKESVQALLWPSGDLFQHTITAKQIKRFPHLQFLWLTNVICQGDFTGCLSELKWISLQYSPFYHQRLEATNLLHLENAVVVNLSGLDITEDAFESLIKGARKLKVLTLCYNTSIHRIPTFPWYSPLEKLTISNFLSLMEIDCSIGNLWWLTNLSFESCVELQKLPEQIGKLISLEYLSLRSCDSLSEFPDSILKLTRLKKLDVSCTRITRLPDSISRLSGLSSVDVSFTRIEKLPSTMSKLLHLQTLHLNHCDWIRELPELPRYLTTLRLTSTSLLTVPNLSYLTNLVELALSDGSESMATTDIIQTCDLRWIGSLSKLRKLQFCFSNVCASTIELGSLSLLEELTLHGLDVPTFELLPSELIVLELHDTRGKKGQLPPLEKETAIVSSSLIESEENKALQQIELKFIESYGLSEGRVHLRGEPGCNELQAPALIDHWRGAFHFPSSFNMLRKFVLWGCPEVQDIQFFSTLESLLVFSVGGCASLKRLGGLSNLKNLMELNLDRCPSLHVVEGIDELEFLHQLKIDRCRSVERILDASSSKIPYECSILITCSGKLPDCDQTYDTWESYREKILSRTEQALGSEIEMDFETETGDPLQKTNQENKEKKRKRETDSAKQEGRRKRRKLKKNAWVRLFHPIISSCGTRKMKRRKERARHSRQKNKKKEGRKRALSGFSE